MNSSNQWDFNFEDEEIKYYENYMNENEVDSFCDIDLQLDTSLHKDNEIKSIMQISNISTKIPEQEGEMAQTKNITESSTSSFIEISAERKNKLKNPINKHAYKNFCSRLTFEASSFRDDFYSIFLNNIKGKKIIPKEKVIEIHNSICEEAGVRKMQRDEYRVINNYFKHFARYRDQIIRCIIRNKEKLSALIDLPSIIERANFIAENRKNKHNDLKNIDLK